MRTIHSSPAFERSLVKFFKRNPELFKKIEKVFALLEKDVHDPALDTHKLHGKLSQFYACKLSYDYRLVFIFDDKYIYPHSIGSHNEVY